MVIFTHKEKARKSGTEKTNKMGTRRNESKEKTQIITAV